MPGFYHLPQSIDDLVDFVAGRVLDTAGVEATLYERWGSRPMTLQPDQVREMFDRISPSYDRMNRVMSMGMDGAWRARAVRCAGLAPGSSALDVCCGTGDLAIELLDAVSTRGRVVGLDFSERMLEAARAKSSQVEWLRGDALDLPFATASSTRARSASASATCPTSSAASARWRASSARAAGSSAWS